MHGIERVRGTEIKGNGMAVVKHVPIWSKVATLVGAAPTLLACAMAAILCQPAHGQPNVVVIVTDDAGYSDFGFNAVLAGTTTEVRTPNIDALASQSVLMTQGYASGPVCSPSRAGFLTGRYQQRMGYEDNPGASDGLPAGEQLLSHHLQNLGYTTGAIGKWHLGTTDNVNRPLDMGFDEFYGFLGGGRPYWRGYPDEERQMRRGDANIEAQWGLQGDTSRYDPVSGRYLTDAFGEEAADFINRHAGDADPFFLYVAVNGPHTPINYKQSDFNSFPEIADPGRRALAAMMQAVDRAVGDITGALTTHGIDDETIVVFMNDNGGAATSVGPYNNAPLKGNKGSLWEGGVRVPYMIKAPGLDPGVYNKAVVSRDIVPTLINAAGGDASQIELDGTDLMPYLDGDVGGDPHDIMFWRHVGGRYIVRKGDWKLVRPGTATFGRLHNLSWDPTETAYYNSQQPALVAELTRELTFWEATLEKPKWGPVGAARNRFDHFVFRNDVASTSKWGDANAWTKGGAADLATFTAEDAYANAVLEFTVRSDADYTATNDLLRMTSQTFMLNQLRFTGDLSGANNRAGTIHGNALLFVSNLDGQLPRLQLDATSTASSANFRFALNTELQLLSDLEITGNGTEEFVIGGNIRDYFVPQGIIKSGSSSVTLGGNNTFHGDLVINQGRVTTTNLASSVVNNGGTYSPGVSAALTNIDGDFEQNSGTLSLQIGGTAPGTGHDRLVIDGAAALGGILDVSLVNGFMPAIGDGFQILTAAGGLTDVFSGFTLPALASGMWHAFYNTTSVSLLVTEEGDFNADGAIDAADYVFWRKVAGGQMNYDDWYVNFGESVTNGAASGDFDGNGVVNTADYVSWKKIVGSQWPVGYGDWRGGFGQTASGGASHSPAVPEPTAFAFFAVAAGLLGCRRRGRVN